MNTFETFIPYPVKIFLNKKYNKYYVLKFVIYEDIISLILCVNDIVISIAVSLQNNEIVNFIEQQIL